MINERSVEVTNRVAIKDRSGNPVSFIGSDHEDATSSFSDTVDLPGGPGNLYVSGTCTLNLMLANSTTALVYDFPSAGFYPIYVRRILSTSSSASGINVYIIR